MKNISAFLFVILLAFAVNGAMAADNDQQAAAHNKQQQRDFISRYVKCVVYADSIDRLACFDAISQDMNLISRDQNAKQKQIMATYGFWQIVQSQDSFGRDNIYLKLDSSNELRFSGGAITRPTLTVKCQLQKTDVYVDWKLPLSPSDNTGKKTNIRFSMDTLPEVNENWLLSDDKTAAYATDSAKIIRNLRSGARRAVFIATPTGENPQGADYLLDGFSNALAVLIKQCYPNGNTRKNDN